MKTKQTFVYTVVFSFLLCIFTYGYALTNYTPSHDGMRTVAENQYGLAQLGRCMVQYYLCFRGIMNSPWLIGILGFIYLSFTVFFLAKIFEIESTERNIFILSAVTTLNICALSTICVYNYVFDVNMLAFLLSVASVFFTTRKEKKYIIAGVFLLSISLGLYQSYVAVAISLYVILFEKNIVEKGIKFASRNAIKCFVSVFTSGILYVIETKVILRFMRIDLYDGAYNSVTNIKKLDLLTIIDLIPRCYRYWFEFFFVKKIYSSKMIVLLNIVIFVIGSVLIFNWIRSSAKSKIELFLFVIVLLLFPIANNCIFILSGGSIHNLMVMSMQMTYLLVLLPSFQKTCPKVIGVVVFISVALMSWAIIRYANGALYYMKNVGEGTFASMTRLDNEIEKTEGFNAKQNKIIVIGNPEQALKRDYKLANVYSNVTGLNTDGTTITHAYTFNWYFNYILGRDYLFENLDEQNEAIASADAIVEMPCYPNDGYCQMYDDYLVIKFENK